MKLGVDFTSSIRFPLAGLHEWRKQRLTREALALLSLGADRAPGFDEALTRWLLRSPDHVAAWLNVTAFYEEAARSLHYPELGTIAVAINGCRTPTVRPKVAPESSVPPLEHIAPTPRRRLFTAALVATAASVVLAVAVGGALWFQHSRSAPTEYSTQIGEHRVVRLSDGTSVHLNTNSRIAVGFTPERRRVELLQGEALFDVAKDARPFRVRSGKAVIEDIGTRFDVRLDVHRIDVSVIEGQVRIGITPHADSTDEQWPRVTVNTLNAGESVSISARIDAELPVIDLPGEEVLASRLAWTSGMLQFKGVSLDEAVREFNRYNVRQIRIADPEIGALKIGGQFLSTSPDRFARALKTWGVRTVEPAPGARPNEPIRLVRGQP